MNLYGFGGGDPVNNSDPFGTCPLVLALAGPQGLAAAAVWCLGEAVLVAGAASSATAIMSDRVSVGWNGQLIPTVGGRHQGEDAQVQEQGELHGCMTCGTTNPGTPTGRWIRNHVPPTSVKLPGEEQQLGPHCKSCSDAHGWLAKPADSQVERSASEARKTEASRPGHFNR